MQNWRNEARKTQRTRHREQVEMKYRFIYLFRKRCVQKLTYYHFNCDVTCLVLLPSTPPIRESSDTTGKW